MQGLFDLYTNRKNTVTFFFVNAAFWPVKCIYSVVFHRILDFKRGWISIRPFLCRYDSISPDLKCITIPDLFHLFLRLNSLNSIN